MKFEGIITALATPFYQKELDQTSFLQLLKNQLECKVDGLVIAGTTGEAPTLSPHEISQLMEWARGEVSGQVPIILGIGHNHTEQAILNTKNASQLKADGVLAVVPYYNKPSQEGLVQHFTAIAKSTDLPILLYNVPSRTHISLQLETIVKLAKIPNIVGIKEASGDMDFDKKLADVLSDSFTITSGDDSTYLELAHLGGQGVISVASHHILQPMKQFLQKVKDQPQVAKKYIQEFHSKYDTFIDLLFKVSNPMMVKQVLLMKGLIRSAELRLPLVEPPPAFTQQIKHAMEQIK